MRWACPDLGVRKPDGFLQPIPGTQHEFPTCPAYGLRTTRDLLHIKGDAQHLIGGAIHPAQPASMAVTEIEAGAVRLGALPNKLAECGVLMQRERADRTRYELERAKEKHGS